MATSQRITSIDALRAFALFGILMVHVAQLYNFYNPAVDLSHYTPTDEALRQGLLFVFEDRCRTIFCMLFGASFYLMMRNPAYTTLRFCWRCILLMGFGLINMYFYNSDFLFCYGIVGVLLALLPVRRMSPPSLFLLAALLYCQQFVPFLDYTSCVFPSADYLARHTSGFTLASYLGYPFTATLAENIRMFLPGLSVTLSYFVFGYAVGRSGWIENIDRMASARRVLLLLAVSILLRTTCCLGVDALRPISTLADSLCYALLFVFLYRQLPVRLTHSLACYGRLGLTNYSVQNICGPLLVLALALPLRASFIAVFVAAVLFYALQLLFATLWLRHHRYGPWEGLWRRLTRLKSDDL